MTKSLGKNKLIRDISANTLQTGVTQVFGLLIFYLTSKYLTKDEFGELNWTMAIGATVVAIASLGLDLIYVRRIAQGQDVLTVSGIHYFHTVVTGIVICALALAVHVMFPMFSSEHPVFFLVFLNLTLANVANSFKLCLNGLEAYRSLALISVISNVIKLSAVLVIFFMHSFNLVNLVYVYVATSIFEYFTAYFLMSRQLAARVRPLLRIVEYKYFILESLPQLGVVLFDSALARIDWIFLGLISTAAATAEYSFVYKVYELCKLPLLIIAPVLLTRFAKIFSTGNVISQAQTEDIRIFFRLELFVLMFIPIVLACTWSPLVDYFTDGKYGQVNELNFILLVVCVPLAAVINFMWTTGFVTTQLKPIMFITIGVSILNIIVNAAIIPIYGSMGAALAFLFTTVVQTLLYFMFIKTKQIKLHISDCVLSFLSAFVAIAFGRLSTNNVIFSAVLAVAAHIGFSVLTRQVSLRQLKQMRNRSTHHSTH